MLILVFVVLCPVGEWQYGKISKSILPNNPTPKDGIALEIFLQESHRTPEWKTEK